MNRSTLGSPKNSPFGRSVAIDQTAFAAVYDQHAAKLFGIIMAIVCDKAQAEVLLEETFVKICLKFGEFRPASQPLFSWLVSIARTTALEAKQDRKKTDTPVLQLTSVGQVVSNPVRTLTDAVNKSKWKPVSSSANALIDAILFRNCTPEEAMADLGLPVATAREQLRQAMQTLRVSGQDE